MFFLLQDRPGCSRLDAFFFAAGEDFPGLRRRVDTELSYQWYGSLSSSCKIALTICAGLRETYRHAFGCKTQQTVYRCQRWNSKVAYQALVPDRYRYLFLGSLPYFSIILLKISKSLGVISISWYPMLYKYGSAGSILHHRLRATNSIKGLSAISRSSLRRK